MSMANPITSPIQIRQTRASFSSLRLVSSIFAWFGVAAPAVIVGQALIAIEKVDMGFRCEFDIPTLTCDPYQNLRRHDIQTKL